jgi:hypothetical protein
LKGYKAALDPSACWDGLEAGIQEAEDAEVDQLESDGDVGTKPKAKKRKRESQAADKPVKAKKEPVEKKKAAVRGSKANKSKETVESEDEAAEDKPVTKKSKKDGNGEWYRLLAVFLVLRRTRPQSLRRTP